MPLQNNNLSASSLYKVTENHFLSVTNTFLQHIRDTWAQRNVFQCGIPQEKRIETIFLYETKNLLSFQPHSTYTAIWQLSSLLEKENLKEFNH